MSVASIFFFWHWSICIRSLHNLLFFPSFSLWINEFLQTYFSELCNMNFSSLLVVKTELWDIIALLQFCCHSFEFWDIHLQLLVKDYIYKKKRDITVGNDLINNNYSITMSDLWDIKAKLWNKQLQLPFSFFFSVAQTEIVCRCCINNN